MCCPGPCRQATAAVTLPAHERLSQAAAALLTLTALAPASAQAPAPAPVTYALLVDRTRSLGANFADVLAASREIVGCNEAQDETLLVSFIPADNIKAAQDFTADKSALLAALGTFHTDRGRRP